MGTERVQSVWVRTQEGSAQGRDSLAMAARWTETVWPRQRGGQRQSGLSSEASRGLKAATYDLTSKCDVSTYHIP